MIRVSAWCCAKTTQRLPLIGDAGQMARCRCGQYWLIVDVHGSQHYCMWSRISERRFRSILRSNAKAAR